MKNITKVLTGIDWKMLKEQKQQIIYLLNEPVSVLLSSQHNALAGILNLLDAIQDAVVEDNLIPETTVFPEAPEGWESIDTTPEDQEAEASAPIEPGCDSTGQLQTAIPLLHKKGTKYHLTHLDEDSAWYNDFKMGLFQDGVILMNDRYYIFDTYSLQLINPKNPIYVYYPINVWGMYLKLEEIKEEPTEVNILGHITSELTVTFINTVLNSDWNDGEFSDRNSYAISLEKIKKESETWELVVNEDAAGWNLAYTYNNEDAARKDISFFMELFPNTTIQQ